MRIKSELLHRCIAYSKAAKPNEIGGYLVGKRDGDDVLFGDIYIPKQVVTSASWRAEPQEVAKLNIKNGVISIWHSHVGMSCSPSSTDLEHVEELLYNQLALEDTAVVYSLITNINGEYKCKVGIGLKKYGMKRIAILDEDVDVHYNFQINQKQIELEVKMKCSNPIVEQPKFELGKRIRDIWNFDNWEI